MQRINQQTPETKYTKRGFTTPPAGLEAVLAVLRLVPLDRELPDLEQDQVVRELNEENRRRSAELTRRLKPRSYRPRWQRYREAKSLSYPDHEALISEEDWPAFQSSQVAEAKKELERHETSYREEYERKRFGALWRVMLNERSEAFAEYILDSRLDQASLTIPGRLSAGDKTVAEAQRYRRAKAFSLPNDPSKTVRLEQMTPAITRYTQFRFQHTFMRRVVTLAASRKATGGRSKITRGFLGSCYIDERDHFQLEFNPILRVLDDDELEISRIRMCANEKCRRIFWAGNITQSGCTTGCSAAQHSRNYYRIHRQPETERWKIRRVLDAMTEGSRTGAKAVAKETGLSIGEANRILMKLFDSGKVDLEDLNGRPQYSKKGK